MLRPRGVPDLSGGCVDVENDPSPPLSSTVYDADRLIPPPPPLSFELPPLLASSSRASASALRSLNESPTFARPLI